MMVFKEVSYTFNSQLSACVWMCARRMPRGFSPDAALIFQGEWLKLPVRTNYNHRHFHHQTRIKEYCCTSRPQSGENYTVNLSCKNFLLEEGREYYSCLNTQTQQQHTQYIFYKGPRVVTGPDWCAGQCSHSRLVICLLLLFNFIFPLLCKAYRSWVWHSGFIFTAVTGKVREVKHPWKSIMYSTCCKKMILQ